jgi:hypothetical protein
MKQIKYIFILILLLSFFKFNAGYEKKHNESILEEKKVKKTIDDFSLIDAITRFVSDILIIS